MRTYKHLIVRLLIASCFVWRCGGPALPERQYPARPQGRKVEIVRTAAGFQLYRHGKPFRIKGGAGYSQLAALRAAGGNTLRTWHSSGLEGLLDEAAQLDIAVMLGLEVVAGRRGLDYGDSAAVARQKARIRQDVLRYKDHPALLMWMVGNEVSLMYQNPAIWPAIEDLAKMIRDLDPEHPVTIAVGATPEDIAPVARYCPSIQILSVNAFSALEALPRRFRSGEYAWQGPYIVSEWSTRGYWERPTTDWDAPWEPASAEKQAELLRIYPASLAADSTRCLGGCLFYWGRKQERTHTWFSLFSAEGKTHSGYDAIAQCWSGRWPANRAPDIRLLRFAGRQPFENVYLKPGASWEAEAEAFDAEGDSLAWRWEIRSEGDYRHIFGGDPEPEPLPLEGLVQALAPGRCAGQAPSRAGAYRLFVYAEDPGGKFAYANFPFFVAPR